MHQMNQRQVNGTPSSPKAQHHHVGHKATNNVSRGLRRAGPACEITSPEPMNKPVPIAPPNESITRWRVVIARFKEGDLHLQESAKNQKELSDNNLDLKNNIIFSLCLKITYIVNFKRKLETDL